MNKKPIQKPLYLQKLEAFSRRIPGAHPKKALLDTKLARAIAGFRGEESLEYNFSFLPEKEYYIFHNLRLPFKSNHFQLDFLILHSSFILISEVKNISGILTFDHENSQLIRQYKGIEEIFADPVDQVNHQRFQLIQWLSRNKLPQVPIEMVVVITNSSSKIQSISPEVKIPDIVIRSSILIEKIKKLTALHDKEDLTKRQMNKLSNQFLHQHSEYDPDLLKQFQIPPSELLKGVYCPFCAMEKMIRVHGAWSCPECNYYSKDEHKTSLKEYAWLISPTITNQLCREFLDVQSVSIASKMLGSMNFRHTGSNKGRVYDLSGLMDDGVDK